MPEDDAEPALENISPRDPAAPPPPARPESDTLTQHETLLLYGGMAGRCAKCKTLVVRESEASGKSFNLGKRAHLVARSEGGPRGDGQIPVRDRGDIRNHVLLCGTCHDEIDRDVEGWPLDRLERLRDEHLAWVARLDEPAAPDHRELIYAKAIDAACELIWLDAWMRWTRYMLHPALSWRPEQIDHVAEFIRRIRTADWPGELPELEVALTRLSYLLGEAASTFGSRADDRGGKDLHVFRRYKQGWNPNYERGHAEFTEWLEYYEGLIFEATQAANWVRSAWRDAGHPEFLADERPHLVTGPHEDLREHINVLEYSDAEREALLAAGREHVESVPTLRLDFSERPPSLGRLLRDILRDELGRECAPDAVASLESRIRALDGVTDTAGLFAEWPGRRPRTEEMKRVSFALLQERVLRRNPDGRGFVRGDLPD